MLANGLEPNAMDIGRVGRKLMHCPSWKMIFAQKSRILVCRGHWDVNEYVGQLNRILDEHIPTD
jgi:hypothetical protein